MPVNIKTLIDESVDLVGLENYQPIDDFSNFKSDMAHFEVIHIIKTQINQLIGAKYSIFWEIFPLNQVFFHFRKILGATIHRIVYVTLYVTSNCCKYELQP